MTEQELHEQIRDIKSRFFALRNGILADQLKQGGVACKTIFGLNIPQIAEIARSVTPTGELARALWDDRDVRESRILACYLFPKESVDIDRARALIADVRSAEEADMLCFRLLKHLPFAATLADEYADSPTPLPAYLSRSLRRHLE